MNYELAKQLKDAGFPNLTEGKGDRYVYPEESELGLSRSQACFIPTLSDLIEACGVNISDFDLRNGFVGGKTGMIWIATLLTRESGENIYQGKGSTPEEAVANLWLELNKK